ncbi:MAG: glycosyltransferase [Actinomycetota bacterium]
MTASTMLVATHGGHISELMGFRPRIADVDDHLWVTSDHPQTRRLLKDEPVEFVPHIATRDLRGVVTALPRAFRQLRGRRFGRVVSTGSAIALAYLPMAALLRIPAHYIESSTRILRPSVSGRILARIPGVTTWWPHPATPSGWKPVTGLYAHFEAVEREETSPEPRHIVVTVGTTDYCFRRLIERLVAIMPSDAEVFWQVGNSDVSELGIDAVAIVDSEELRARIEAADVVVTHAGAGSLLQCLEAGKVPVYVPRLGRHDEQVDDHQVELADWAGQAGLAIRVDASTVSWDDLVRAGRLTVREHEPAPIQLESR